jgi:hypothetical protein
MSYSSCVEKKDELSKGNKDKFKDLSRLLDSLQFNL